MVAPELVAEAVRLGIITEAEAPLYRDPPRERKPWRNVAEHLEHVVKSCSSGAPAIDSITIHVEEVATGRTLPAPPNGEPT